MEKNKESKEEGAPPIPQTGSSSLYARMSMLMHFLIFLYATAFWIQIGVMPFLSKQLGADPVMFGYMETVFAVAMLIGGPLFGRFGDLFGARSALIVAFASSFLTYAVLGVASSIPFLFLSRVFGFMMHAMHGAQMVMTDVSGTKERADALGKLGVSYGVGMVTGPFVGGYVTTYFSEQNAAMVAAGLCVIAIVTVVLMVPASTKSRESAMEQERQPQKDNGSVFDVKAISTLLSVDGVLQLIMMKTVVGIPAGVFHAMFAMVNIDRFELTPQTNGYLLSFIGIVTIVMQGFGVGYISKRYPDSITLRVSMIAMSISYLFLCFATRLYLLIVIMVPMVMSGSLLNTIANSAITKLVPEDSTGTSLGLSMATHSVIRTVSPTLGGYMYQWFGYPSFGMLGFVLIGLLAVYLNTGKRLKLN